MNKLKTKVVMENDTPMYVNSTQTENVENQITARWTAFAKLRDIFKAKMGTCLKRQVYNSYVLPAITQGVETWALTTQTNNMLVAVQAKMETNMLNITYRDRKTNIWLKENTNITDVIEQVRRRKWTYTSAGYEITDGHCVSPPGNSTKGKDLEASERKIGRLCLLVLVCTIGP